MSEAKQKLKWGVRSRLVGSILLAGLVAILLPSWLRWATRTLCIWDAGMICFLGLTWGVMLKATPDTMRRQAQKQDEGRFMILSLVTAAACASLLAIAFLLHDKGSASNLLVLHLVLTALTIIGSWLLVHTIFALHYAHGYYQPSKALRENQAKPLDFPNDDEPDYWDFLYFSFVIGMTSQVSDVPITSRSLRRLALTHGVLSFFFNTTIVALSINIIAGVI
jgi:uncharacterized membrane protein